MGALEQQTILPGFPEPQSSALVPRNDLLAIIDRAVSTPGFDIATLRELMAMKERWDANEAKKAFTAAMNEFKKNPPAIIRNRKGEHHTYAGLDTICKAVMGALSAQGISHRWEYKQEGKDWIEVSCVLTHEQGHSERTTMAGPPDAAGPQGNATKNPIQALASTRTYLERYTLLGAVGLESAYDDDGNGGGKGMSNDVIAEHCEWIANGCNEAEAKKLYANAMNAALEVADKRALDIFREAFKKRKAEL
jgi:hypothetical protein